MDALSPSVRWYSFRPKPGMHGCWTPPVNLLLDSPAMGIQNPSTSRKQTLTTPSAGKVTTALRAAHLSTSIASPAGSSHPWLSHCQNCTIGLNRKTDPPPVRQNANPRVAFRTKSQKLLQVDSRSEERAKCCRTQNTVTSQREAKPDQERNEINGRGPPPAGRMPFMSDSTLIRRSAALRGLKPLTKLPTGNGENVRKFQICLVRSLNGSVSFEEENDDRWCLWRPDLAGIDSRS